MSQKSNMNIAKIKYNAIKLKSLHQIPMQLYLLIEKIDSNTPLEKVRFLVATTEHFLRVRGYWKKYHDQERIANEIILNDYNKL